jgi:hypothetical protein
MTRALFLLLLLGGCAPLSEYQPYVVDVIDTAALANDKAHCLSVAEAYNPGLDLGTIASSAAQGGASNLAGAAVNPYVPVLGAAGGATSATLQGLGLLSSAQKRVFLLCLSHLGERSRAYDVVDPNQ